LDLRGILQPTQEVRFPNHRHLPGSPSHETGIDLEQAVLTKLKKNAEKYPVDKAKGSSRKYDELIDKDTAFQDSY